MFRKPKAKGTLRKRLSEDDSGTGSGATEQEKNDKDKDAQVFFNSRVPETFCNWSLRLSEFVKSFSKDFGKSNS